MKHNKLKIRCLFLMIILLALSACVEEGDDRLEDPEPEAVALARSTSHSSTRP
jgi:hypothetical protein